MILSLQTETSFWRYILIKYLFFFTQNVKTRPINSLWILSLGFLRHCLFSPDGNIYHLNNLNQRMSMVAAVLFWSYSDSLLFLCTWRPPLSIVSQPPLSRLVMSARPKRGRFDMSIWLRGGPRLSAVIWFVISPLWYLSHVSGQTKSSLARPAMSARDCAMNMIDSSSSREDK